MQGLEQNQPLLAQISARKLVLRLRLIAERGAWLVGWLVGERRGKEETSTWLAWHARQLLLLERERETVINDFAPEENVLSTQERKLSGERDTNCSTPKRTSLTKIYFLLNEVKSERW